MVHLLKNVGNNFLNYCCFIFPDFKFNDFKLDDFYDEIEVPSGEITWKLLHDVYKVT